MSAHRQQALHGVRALATATLFAKGIGFASQMVLARLLAREHFGVFAFTIGIVTLLGTLANFEPRRDILRDPERAAARARAYVFAQAAIGLLVALLLFTGADWIAERIRGLMAPIAGGSDGLSPAPYLRGLAVVPLFEALRLPAVAMLEVRMQFRAAARLEWAAAVLQVAAGIVLALAGAGAWALVGSFCVGSAVRCCGSWWIEGASPLRARCTSHDLASVWRFGGPLLVANLMTAWFWKADDLMVGAALGFVAAGLYSVAFELPRAMLQVTESLGRVGLALLGRSEGKDPARQARIFGIVVRASFALLAPAAVVGIVHAETLLAAVFGAKWRSAAPAFQVFLVLVLLRGSFRHWVDVASTRGRPELLTRACIATSIALPLFGWIGLRWGILGMSLAVVATWAVPAPFYLAWVRKELDVRFGSLLWPGFLALCCGLVVGWLLAAGMAVQDPLRFLVMAVQLVVFGLVLVRCDPELIGLLRETLQRRVAR